MDTEIERKREERRRRTCIEELQRDPAGKIALQLLALLSVGLSLFPPLFEAPSIRRDRRQPPPGYDLGPAAWARERGLEPEDDIESPTVPEPRLRAMPRPLPTCSWSRLVKDLRRRPTRVRARAMIEQRVPAAALPWLRNVILEEDWSTLRFIGRNADPELIGLRALASAAAAEMMERQPDVVFEDDVESAEQARP